MATIVTRAGKGSPLLNTEIDANVVNLNNDKIENSAFNAGTVLYATNDDTPEPKSIPLFSDILFGQGNYLNDNKVYARGTSTNTDTNHWIGYEGTIDGWRIQSNGGVQIENHLFINGGINRSGGFGYLNGSGATGTGTGTSSFSIQTTNRIGCSEFNAFSDVRIKDVEGASDSELDIQILMSLEITDYVYKETGQPAKKIIAQQVEKHFPQCVTKIQRFIPDILRVADSIDNIAETSVIKLSEHRLSTGDFVEIESSISTSKIHLEIIESTDTTFTVKGNYPDAFVVGRRVDDFRVVDYDAISMLAVSALQHEIKERQEMQLRISKIEEYLKHGGCP